MRLRSSRRGSRWGERGCWGVWGDWGDWGDWGRWGDWGCWAESGSWGSMAWGVRVLRAIFSPSYLRKTSMMRAVRSWGK